MLPIREPTANQITILKTGNQIIERLLKIGLLSHMDARGPNGPKKIKGKHANPPDPVVTAQP